MGLHLIGGPKIWLIGTVPIDDVVELVGRLFIDRVERLQPVKRNLVCVVA